ncbi:hypothetical protein RhiJN_24685 [Ceratobasidium sp. AG-Ba]|nr:hypothetical protein RhiJN_24682 [Ceratobasidium sp. AG-Ba]QRV96667.1 hypothetical protein RhiJN_24685 [Ceratobasidium sp. AG-Ba]
MRWHSDGIAFRRSPSPSHQIDLSPLPKGLALDYPPLQVHKETQVHYQVHDCSAWNQANDLSSGSSEEVVENKEMARAEWERMLEELKDCPKCAAIVAVEGGQCHEPCS